MQDIKMLVREFINANPSADINDANKHAQAAFSDLRQKQEFISQWLELAAKNAEWRRTVDRICPDDD